MKKFTNVLDAEKTRKHHCPLTKALTETKISVEWPLAQCAPLD